MNVKLMNVVKTVILYTSDIAVKNTVDEIVNNNVSENEDRTPMNRMTLQVGSFIISTVAAALITHQFSDVVESALSKISKKF
jgi:Ca2+/H+ antiporter